MADVIMPQMGESIAEGTVTKWLKNVGDKVERDEPLFEISTDKVDAEIPSPAAGILKEIRVGPGTTVPINTVVGVIAAGGEAQPQPQAQPTPQAAPPPGVTTLPPIPMPPPAAPAPPEPAAAPAPAPPPAPVAAPPPPPPPPPAPAPRPAPPLTFAPPAPPPPVEYHIEGERQTPPTAEKPREEMTAEELRLTRSSPVVRKIAAEHQVDLSGVPGTGIGGRVTKQDILSHIEGRGTQPSPASPAAPTPAPASPTPAAPAPAGSKPEARPAAPAGSRVQVVPMSPIRKKTAEHMVLSKRTSAHVSTVFEIDFTRIDQLRQKHRASFEERGVKLTYMPFVLKAVVDGLVAFPELNASIEGDNIVYRKDINLGIAVALEWGLIVPVVHNAEEKNVLGLGRAVQDLAQRARAKKLKVEEVQGGTFTITNPGVFGSLFGTPIINQPQVAILGLGTIEKRPVVRDDAIAIRTMAYVALTFDHRLVDGADADRFMAHVKKTLQEFDESSL
jgi:2-oxoglutarate dehydrogenase E2 component (dihydrolipoamide succinyltransferase)